MKFLFSVLCAFLSVESAFSAKLVDWLYVSKDGVIKSNKSSYYFEDDKSLDEIQEKILGGLNNIVGSEDIGNKTNEIKEMIEISKSYAYSAVGGGIVGEITCEYSEGVKKTMREFENGASLCIMWGGV
jgi:hypothetical protein